MKLTNKDIVLFSGDSITDGNRGHSMDCNHIMGHGYQYIVAGELAVENAAEMPKFVNKGYSGYTMGKILNTWQEDVIDNKPTYLSILAGVNDGIFGQERGFNPKQAADNYRKDLESAVIKTQNSLQNTKIIICEPFYFPLDRKNPNFDFVPHPYCEENHGRPDRNETDESVQYRLECIEYTRAAAKEIAQKYSLCFVSFYSSFSNAVKASNTQYFIWDSTHPTVAGHMLMAKEWLKAVNKAFDKA